MTNPFNLGYINELINSNNINNNNTCILNTIL